VLGPSAWSRSFSGRPAWELPPWPAGGADEEWQGEIDPPDGAETRARTSRRCPNDHSREVWALAYARG